MVNLQITQKIVNVDAVVAVAVVAVAVAVSVVVASVVVLATYCCCCCCQYCFFLGSEWLTTASTVSL